MLGPDISAALSNSDAQTLFVEGESTSRLALSLPFELLFCVHDPRRIVVRSVRHDTVDSQTAPERVVAGFTLTADTHYLPHHLEADLLAEHARAAAIDYDELFVAFTGEDLLSAVRGASVVHLAGHGKEGAIRCEWRDGTPSALTSTQLIEAWRDRPPRLVVLGFCESSSARDEFWHTEVVARGQMTLEQIASWTSSSSIAPSSSMAVDIVGALPTAVVAMRTDADDKQARQFLNSFYAAHLREGASIEQAYDRALIDSSFHDGVGLPVPILYVGGESPLHAVVTSDPEGGSSRCLSRPSRRCLNTFYEVVSPLGATIGDRWACRITGSNSQLRSRLLDALLEAVRKWREITHTAGVAPAFLVSELTETTWEAFSGSGHTPLPPLSGFCIDLDRWAPDITLGEILCRRADVPFSDRLRVATATADVPATVDAVLRNDLGAIAGQLREFATTGPKTDWEMARELLRLLPKRDGAAIVEWTDRRWQVVQAAGQRAIDVLACIAAVPKGERLLAADQPYLAAVAIWTDVDVRDQTAAIRPLTDAGILSYGTGAVTAETTENLTCDLLIARRAWDARSPLARTALQVCRIDRELSSLPSLSYLESVGTARLAELALLCSEADHLMLEPILEELVTRDAGEELLAVLPGDLHLKSAESRTPSTLGENKDPRWGNFDDLIDAGRFADAAELLDLIEVHGYATDHPLRVTANRLRTRLADSDQQALLLDACRLEERLEGEASLADRGEALMDLLLATRQIQASALRVMSEFESAGEVLLHHFHEALKYGSRASVCLFAGAQAVSLLALGGSTKRGRAVLNRLLAIVEEMQASHSTVLVHTAEVDLLSAEGRRVHAAAAATDLLRELAAWSAPRREQIRASCLSCATASLGSARSMALFALVELTGPTRSDRGGLAALATWSSEVTVEAAIDAADEIAAQAPTLLTTLGLEPNAYRNETRAFIEDLKLRLTASSTAEIHIGQHAMDTLAQRAAAGCVFSIHILCVAAPAFTEWASRASRISAADYDFTAIVRRFGPLRQSVRPVLLDAFKPLTSLAIHAWHGDREACMVLAGLLANNESPTPPPEVQALMALAAQDLAAALQALRHVDGLALLASVCVTIEECCASKPSADEARAPEAAQFGPLARERWESILNQSAVHPPSAQAARTALGGIGGTRLVAMGLIVAARQGATLDWVYMVDALDEPVTSAVFQTLEQRPDIQLALAEELLRSEPGRADLARAWAETFDPSDSPGLLVRVNTLRLIAATMVERAEVMEAALGDLLVVRDTLEPDADEMAVALDAIATAALKLRDPETALNAANALRNHPLAKENPHFSHRAFAHIFHGLFFSGRFNLAAETLAEAGEEAGYSVACSILTTLPAALEAPMASPAAAVMLALARAERKDTFAGSLRSARANLVALLGDSEPWQEVRLATEMTLAEQP
ncbi:MAG: hypothetical protein WB709_12910 [Solirubrobacteraceae bacterium]